MVHYPPYEKFRKPQKRKTSTADWQGKLWMKVFISIKGIKKQVTSEGKQDENDLQYFS